MAFATNSLPTDVAPEDKNVIPAPASDPEKLKFVIKKLKDWQPISTMPIADEGTKEKFHAWLTVGGGYCYRENFDAFNELLLTWLDIQNDNPGDDAKGYYLSALRALDKTTIKLEMFFQKFPDMVEFLHHEFSDTEAQFEEANKAFQLHQIKERPDDTLLAVWEKARGINQKKSENTEQKKLFVDLTHLNQELRKQKVNLQKNFVSELKDAKVSFVKPSEGFGDTKSILKEITTEKYRSIVSTLEVFTQEGVTYPMVPMRINQLASKAEEQKDKPNPLACEIGEETLSNQEMCGHLLGPNSIISLRKK